MGTFVLNEKLSKDCFDLGKLNTSQLLLLNNALVPWFILVPRVAVTELYQLEHIQQHEVLDEINQLSKFIKQRYSIDKLNVATIGNIVEQLHIHVIGRSKGDFCWPGVVWGQEQRQDYNDEQVVQIRLAVENFFQGAFTPVTREHN